jgi:molecular chaperone GrpE
MYGGIDMEEDQKLDQNERMDDSAKDSADIPEGECTPSELETLRQEYTELKDRYLRLAADFDNYKKRIGRETEDRVTYAIEAFAVEMLDVVDNLERARASDDSSLREGIEQIHKFLTAVLRHHGITPIECLNAPFDPASQEALAYVPSDREDGIVIDEVIRGYAMGDKVIRCAKVAVSKGKDKEE